MLHAILLSFAVAAGEGDAKSAEGPEVEIVDRLPCFDTAVVGKIVKQEPIPFDREPDLIYMQTPRRLTIAVKDRFGRPDDRRVVSARIWLHTDLLADGYQLFFLRLARDGDYRISDRYSDVVRDRSGRFVMPLARPHRFNPEYDRYIPANYTELLRPVQYRPKDLPSLSNESLARVGVCYEERDEESTEERVCADPYDFTLPVDAAAYPWGTLVNGNMVADRGLFVSDFVAAIPDRRCPG